MLLDELSQVCVFIEKNCTGTQNEVLPMSCKNAEQIVELLLSARDAINYAKTQGVYRHYEVDRR
jgi:hypothetical protein